jgi:L-cysteine S-thiosulfotransferase
VKILFLPVCAWLAAGTCAAEPSAPAPLQPGTRFQSADVRALQADDFANPGMLWVAQGAELWEARAAGQGKSCAACHGDAARSMKGVAARYPRFDPELGRVVNLEARIDACSRRNVGGPGLAPESPALLALSTFVAHQSRGMPVMVETDGPARPAFERGRDLYRTRVGQLNLACTHCHDARWGKTILAETISQGHPTGWPAYRLEWQALGSLQRRLRACFFGVRAEQPPFGSGDLVALELYLAARGRGLPVEAPGVRR